MLRRHDSRRSPDTAIPVVIADDSYVEAPPTSLAPLVADPASWARWWPDLSLTLRRDRGAEGCVWAVSGPWTGEMEVWLEAVCPGTVVHWQVRAVTCGSGRRAYGRVARDAERRRRAWKAVMFGLQDSVKPVKDSGDRAEGD